MNRIVFVCEDNIENILTGVFTAFEYCKKGYIPDAISIIVSSDGAYETEFFSTYIHIDTDYDKAFKTMEHIRKKLGGYIHTDVLRVLCHYDAGRGNVLFRVLYDCFKYGGEQVGNLVKDYVRSFMELSRKSANESHHFNGFVRFNNINGILYSQIEPKCNVIPLIVDHFSERFFIENWIIEDTTRKLFAVHKAYGETRFFMGDFNLSDIGIRDVATRDEYEALWKTFFESIAIKERTNPRCQRNLMPLWMRTHMNEFI